SRAADSRGGAVNRRQVLARLAASGAIAGVAPGFWQQALSPPAQPGESPYGPLPPPAPNGLMLPDGSPSQAVAFSLLPGADTGSPWHLFPDGGACVPTEDGGWIYVSNSEHPPPVDVPGATGLLSTIAGMVPALPATGGASAIRFDAEGNVVDAYSILAGT